MQSMTRRAALAATLTTAGAALAACSNRSSTATATSTGDMSPDDLEFVTTAFQVIEFDRQQCTIAQTQGSTPEIRALATDLLKRGEEFDAQLRPIAAAAGIRPPTLLRTDLRVRAGRLRLAQGREFDSTFLEDQIFSHQDALNMQNAVMATPGSNPKLRELSSKGTAQLVMSLKRMRALQKTMMMAPA